MKAGLLVAASWVLLPAAHAQNLCADIQRVIAQAPCFDGLKDEENFEDNFESGLYLPNAYSSWIDTSGVSLFACGWQFDAPDQTSAKLDQLQAVMKPCFVGWKQTDLAGTQSGAKREIARGFSLGGSASDPNVVVNVYIRRPGERGSPAVNLDVTTFSWWVTPRPAMARRCGLA